MKMRDVVLLGAMVVVYQPSPTRWNFVASVTNSVISVSTPGSLLRKS
jgi:hypothetical protein